MIGAFIVSIATGETLARLRLATVSDIKGYPVEDGQAALFYTGAADIEDVETYLDGEVKIRPRTVDPALALGVARAETLQRLQARRDIAEFGGILRPEGVIQTDEGSQRKINGAVTEALIKQVGGQPFSIDWTMLDNSTVTYDAAGMIEMGLAVLQHVNLCHEVGREKRAEIEAATTVAQIEAVDLDAGWPA